MEGAEWRINGSPDCQLAHSFSHQSTHRLPPLILAASVSLFFFSLFSSKANGLFEKPNADAAALLENVICEAQALSNEDTKASNSQLFCFLMCLLMRGDLEKSKGHRLAELPKTF